MQPTRIAESPEAALARAVAEYVDDPLGFVYFAYPWQVPKGPLEQYDGPDAWQRELLEDIGREVRSRRFDRSTPVLPIRQAISSGHGIGKSTISAWLAGWIFSTRPNSIGTVTSNTFSQLASKTWPTIVRWMKLAINAHWFEVGAEKIFAKAAPESWFVTAQTCRKENSEAFHGQHAARSTSWYRLCCKSAGRRR